MRGHRGHSRQDHHNLPGGACAGGTGDGPGIPHWRDCPQFFQQFPRGRGCRVCHEGDEYDTAYFDKTPKFFKYEPEIVLFTSLEFDHADIYPDLDAIRFQFSKLLESLPSQGLAIACVDDPNVKALLPRAPCPVITYGFSEEAELRLSAWRAEGAGGVFVTESKGVRSEWHLPAPGRHNALNAAAVVALARHLGHEDAAIQRAFSGFLGVKRRQEVRGEAGGVTVLDDFAHHPTAIALTI
ncbi:MAG: Mur ligase family protein, partial [Deltaproteobacteria bacterium]|nr:Mur ligase family protein [Deltaproteobacteria bacterium]